LSTNGSGSDLQRYRLLFERVRTGMAVATAEGRFLAVNPAFCETVGYTSDELADLDFVSLTHPDDRAHNLALVREILAGRRESFTIEKRYLTKDAGPVWVRANVSALREDGVAPRLIATTEDLSTQKEVEARLEESQDLLRIAGRVGRVGGWAIDTDPVKLYWSDEVHDLAGYPRGATPPLEEALGLYPPLERDRMGAAVETCMNDGVPFDIECLFTPPGTEPLWVRVVGEPKRDADGTVERIHGAIIDISEQKRAQEETARLAERLHRTMESITDALYTVDNDWCFAYVNQRAGEVLERDVDELIGRNLWDEFPAVVGSPLEEAFRRAVAEQRTVVLDEYHYPPLERYFGINVYPSDQGLAVYFRDVTHQHHDRHELEQRGARLAEQAALLDEAQDAIIVRDLDDRITYWNRSAERLYGWTAEEATGRRIQHLLHLDPDEYAGGQQVLLDEGSYVDEMTKRAKDGRQLIVECRWTLVRDDDGAPNSVLGIDTDITERKRIEQQFLRSQRMESLGKLAGGIAHDLNNALLPISASIELLRDREQDPLKQRLLGVMEASARHGAEMVDQVLSFARGVGGKREPLGLGDVVEEVRRISTDTFPKNISIVTDVAADLWPVVGDATQLQQVLVNLCVNARDAMPEGGTITIDAENTDRHGGPSRHAGDDPYVTLRVSDTGLGVPAEVREQIFDPFFTTKPSGEGTGLGLSTSAVIVDSHGGDIALESEPNVRTTFRVCLPAAPDRQGGAPAEPAEIQWGDGELVLVVDDEPGIREVARLVLETYGYRPLLASDGGQAVEVFETRGDEIAVVVTDLMMPVLDGYEVISGVRARRPHVPVIVTSGLHTSEASDRAAGAGADLFLPKPFDTPALLAAIGEVLSSRRPT
jgi:two-component system, cell cycle sensor histidine kinase and response regulator CckA